jgi:hypothetical protein
MNWQQQLQAWQEQMSLNRARTLATLDAVASQPQPEKAIGFRPGPGRAHIAWQLVHIGITENLFATERLFPDQSPMFPELVPRFRGGSTVDDDIPSFEVIRDVLSQSRERLFASVGKFGADDLNRVVASLKDGRNLTMQQIMHILCWHEPHHQGQAHITLNLYKAQA